MRKHEERNIKRVPRKRSREGESGYLKTIVKQVIKTIQEMNEYR